MALVLKDRVKETTTTTGTGTYTLAGAVTGYQSFSVVGNNNTTYYTVTDGTNWEVGIGTYTSSGTTLSRNTILESSNAGSAVNWGAGSKDVFVTYPAERAIHGQLYKENSTSPVAPSSTGTNSIAIGEAADASTTNTLAIGYSATAQGNYSTAIGSGSGGNGANTIAAGAVALGYSYASGSDSFAAGVSGGGTYGSKNANSVAIGRLATASASDAIAIGYSATANSAYQIAIGGSSSTVKISGAYSLPTTDGTNGQALVTNGSGVLSFSTISGGVSSVTASSPLASSGGSTPNISLSGTVAIANGGTGQTTANAALNALLPSQVSNSGKFLTTDGTNTSWAAAGGGGGGGSSAGSNIYLAVNFGGF